MLPTLEKIRKKIKEDIDKEGNLSLMLSGLASRNHVLKNESDIHYELELLPHNVDYFHPIPTLFLSLEHHLERIQTNEYFLCRDGLYPLCVFFYSYPVPQIETVFFVHKNFAPFVPTAWKNQIAYYSIESNAPCFNPEEVIITGQTNECFIDTETLEEKLLEIKKKNLSLKKVSAFLSAGKEFFKKEETFYTSRPFKYFQKISRAFELPIDFLSLNELENARFKNCVHFDLNENKMAISDDYLLHVLYSKGVAPIFAQNISINEDDLVLPYSHAHSIRLSFHEEKNTANVAEKIRELTLKFDIKKSPERAKIRGISEDFFTLITKMKKELRSQKNC